MNYARCKYSGELSGFTTPTRLVRIARRVAEHLSLPIPYLELLWVAVSAFDSA